MSPERSEFLEMLEMGLEDADPFMTQLLEFEEKRQKRKIILIPSETICPRAVRQALASPFTSVYAEGYPPQLMEGAKEEELEDIELQLTRYRRYGDRRFYKGTEYVHLVEELAKARARRLFSSPECPPEAIFVNVQPLSGAAANNAVYHALMKPGDTLMGMGLAHGGHLTHGSDLNRSGQLYRGVSYWVSEETGLLDYDAILRLALDSKPRVIVAGFTSYPWAPDWKELRRIADEVGAYLLADVAHPAGLIVAGLYPNPVGVAHVVTFTTHKTLCGPRGAVIMCTDPGLAQKIDSAVFPGEQGGPHVNKIAAMAVAFGMAEKESFRNLQRMIVENARLLCEALSQRGAKIAYGGTNTHLLVLSLRGLGKPTGYPLYGEIAARILDLAGIVVNRNTIPGDQSFAQATGIRLGTPWVTQRGMGPEEMRELAEIICLVLEEIRPFTYMGSSGPLPRGKIPQEILEHARRRTRELLQRVDPHLPSWSYPHETNPERERGVLPKAISVRGERAMAFLQEVCTRDLREMKSGEVREGLVLDERGEVRDGIRILKEGPESFLVSCSRGKEMELMRWFRNLSDGYVVFDEKDLLAKVQGPVRIEGVDECPEALRVDFQSPVGVSVAKGDCLEFPSSLSHLVDLDKPYFVGLDVLSSQGERRSQEASWVPPEEPKHLKRTPLHSFHTRHAKKVAPFAGWEMPIWYTSIQEEHRAVRQKAGLFDVSHMGTIGVSGEDAEDFLDILTTNYVRWLKVGESHYSFLLEPGGAVIDDLILYRIGPKDFLMVANAINAFKVISWLQAVAKGEVFLDVEGRGVRFRGEVEILDLKGPEAGERALVDVALQGPRSLEILERMARDLKDRWSLRSLSKGHLAKVRLGPSDAWVARTGYTGEQVGFEIFVHPHRVEKLWQEILVVGEALGCVPAGLGARDSLRIEAGLPLYGAELAGPLGIDPMEAGFGNYVKLHKPFFSGRKAMVERSRLIARRVVRFRLNQKGVRLVRAGDLVVHRRTQQLMGWVTSAAPNGEGIQMGLALVEDRFAEAGTPIALLSKAPKVEDKEPSPGQRINLHEEGVLLTRFPGRDIWR